MYTEFTGVWVMDGYVGTALIGAQGVISMCLGALPNCAGASNPCTMAAPAVSAAWASADGDQRRSPFQDPIPQYYLVNAEPSIPFCASHLVNVANIRHDLEGGT